MLTQTESFVLSVVKMTENRHRSFATTHPIQVVVDDFLKYLFYYPDYSHVILTLILFELKRETNIFQNVVCCCSGEQILIS